MTIGAFEASRSALSEYVYGLWVWPEFHLRKLYFLSKNTKFFSFSTLKSSGIVWQRSGSVLSKLQIFVQNSAETVTYDGLR